MYKRFCHMYLTCLQRPDYRRQECLYVFNIILRKIPDFKHNLRKFKKHLEKLIQLSNIVICRFLSQYCDSNYIVDE
jgi:hypothetical protein